MARAITDWRIARSFIGQAGVSTAEPVELDHNIGVGEAIEIASITGVIAPTTITAPAAFAFIACQQTLHIEDGTLDTPGLVATDADDFNRDSEIIYEQALSVMLMDGTTEAGAAMTVTPSGIQVFAKPILSPINPTHRARNSANITAGFTLLMEYRYVELSSQELGLQFARRRR